jgi:hypothetical protein
MQARVTALIRVLAKSHSALRWAGVTTRRQGKWNLQACDLNGIGRGVKDEKQPDSREAGGSVKTRSPGWGVGELAPFYQVAASKGKGEEKRRQPSSTKLSGP